MADELLEVTYAGSRPRIILSGRFRWGYLEGVQYN